MADLTKPQPGDIYIARRAHSAPTFDVGTDLTHLQLRFENYSDAARHADGAGRRSHVDVWRTNDGLSFECVGRYRL